MCYSDRAYYCVFSVRILVSDSRWNYSVACTRVNRVMLINLCAETINPFLRGTESDGCGMHQFVMYNL